MVMCMVPKKHLLLGLYILGWIQVLSFIKFLTFPPEHNYLNSYSVF